MIAMLISGGLAGMMAINNVMGEAERLVLNAVGGGWVYWHRRRADGAQPPAGCLSCRDPVRVSLPGRRRACPVDIDPARADRGHSGAGDPVHRRAGQHGPDAAGTHLSRDPPRPQRQGHERKPVEPAE